MKETTMIGFIFIVVVLVVGGLVYTQAPKVWSWLENIGGGLGAGNNAQIVWFANYSDGTSEILGSPMSVIYGGKAVDYIGFKTQVKLNFNAESAVIQYDADLLMGIDDTPKQQATMNGKMNIDESGAWQYLTGASISFRDETIEAWTDVGTHILFSEVDVSLTIIYDGKSDDLAGSASGTATIEITENVATMELTVKPISVTQSIYPLT